MIPSLVGKIVYFTSKNRLKTQVTVNGATRSFATFLGSLTGKVQLWHLEGYCEPISNGKLGNFSLVGKQHPLRETNFPFDIGSKRDN
jgi:hypothetical protein